MEERCLIVGIIVWKKSSFQPTEKIVPKFSLSPKTNFEKPYCTIQTLYWKSPSAIKSFGRFIFDWVCFETQKQVVLLQDFVHLHIAIRPQILSISDDTRAIVEMTPHSHIQRYFCHKPNANERIFLSIFFSQHYCNSCSFLLFHFLH